MLKGKAIYPVALGADPHGNITRLDNLLAGYDERIANAENRLESLLQQQKAAQAEMEKPVPQEEELAQGTHGWLNRMHSWMWTKNITSRRWKKRRMRNLRALPCWPP